MIQIQIYHVTELATNCCYLVDEATGKKAVVDPGAKSERLIEQIEKDGGKLEYVMLTHGHYDHILYAKQLANRFDAKIVTGKHCDPFLQDCRLNGVERHRLPEFQPFCADILLEDADKFKLGETEITYLYTPGHTSGSGVFLLDDIMISGDTLFCESYGRTDLPSGNDDQMIASLRRLKELEGDYQVIPGHGPSTTLSHERLYNPLMRML